MSSQKNQNSSTQGKHVVQLPQRLVSEELAAVQQLLSQYLVEDGSKQAVVIDGRNVGAIDIFGLQLIVWFQLKANQVTVPWVLLSSRKLISSERMFGLSEFVLESTYAEVQ